jgi:hypothetical protein
VYKDGAPASLNVPSHEYPLALLPGIRMVTVHQSGLILCIVAHEGMNDAGISVMLKKDFPFFHLFH